MDQAECFRVELIRQAYLMDDVEATRGLTGDDLQTVYRKASDSCDIPKDRRAM